MVRYWPMGVALLLLITATAFASANGLMTLSDLAGSYSWPHQVEIEGIPEPQDVVDQLQIVKLSHNRAYIIVDLQFRNGHACQLYGIADYEKGALVYRSRVPDYANAKAVDPMLDCELRIQPEGGRLVLQDNGGVCRTEYCSARAHFDDESFELRSKRPISNVSELLSSQAYKDVMDEYNHR